MKKYITIVPFLKIAAVFSVVSISTYVTTRIFLYESPYKNIQTKIKIIDNKIKIKDFEIKIYPTDGHEILIKAHQYYSDLNDLNKHSFSKVQTYFK